MPAVVIVRRIVCRDTVQPVLQRVVADFVRIQEIADRIRITEYINLLIALKVHRHIGGFKRSQFPAEANAVPQIMQEAPGVSLQRRQFRKKARLLPRNEQPPETARLPLHGKTDLRNDSTS